MSGGRIDLGFGEEADEASFSDVLADPKSLLGGLKKKKKPRVDEKVIEESAKSAGFQSRERRRRTGRNVQLNIKTTAEAKQRFYDIVDDNELGLGEAFEKALILLEKSYSTK